MKKLLIVAYFVFLLLFVIFSYLFIDPGLFYLRVIFTNFSQLHRTPTTILFIFFLLFSFVFYFISLYAIQKSELDKKEVFILIILTAAVLLFAYPAMLSFDIFNYIATAKVAFFYHENPYLIMPIAFTNDPLLLFMHAANKTALYAPFWILLTGIPYLLGFGNFLVTLFNFKLFVAIFYGATIWLLWKMTKNLFQTALFALNPLVMIETLISGHNDIVMMFLLLVSMYFLVKKDKRESFFFLLLSIGIKYATAILAPLYIVSFFRTISKEKIFLWTTLCMYAIFFLSSFREEIYPWYALWFLLPMSVVAGDTALTWISLTFSFSLLLRYIPFMLLATYFGPTPFLKIAFTFIPVVLSIGWYIARKRHIRFF